MDFDKLDGLFSEDDEFNEIDMMYIGFAIGHRTNGGEMDEETADAVNESIDRFLKFIDNRTSYDLGDIDFLDNEPEKVYEDTAKHTNDGGRFSIID